MTSAHGKYLTLALSVGFALGISCFSVVGAPLYSVRDLGPMGRQSNPGNLNELGHVVFWTSPIHDGRSDSPPGKAFLFDGRSAMELPSLGGRNNWAIDINEQGAIVGGVSLPDEFTLRPALFRNGDLHLLDHLGNELFAVAINDRDQVVGKFAENNTTHPFFLDPNVGFVDLGAFGDISGAVDINNSGMILAYAYYNDRLVYANGIPYVTVETLILDRGTVTPTSHLGGHGTLGFSINEKGQVVGESIYGDNRRENHAYLFDLERGIIDLGVPGESSTAFDVNDLSVVVGQAYDYEGNASEAFIYDAEHGRRFLNELIPGGPLLRSAHAINNRGQILAQGYVTGDHYLLHTFLLTPTPEPGSLLTALIAVAPTLLWRRRR
jgi:probable HAF family extracellular repeat protein